jgi:hypothetical protein
MMLPVLKSSKRVKEFNYVPTKKTDVYAVELLGECKKGNPE